MAAKVIRCFNPDFDRILGKYIDNGYTISGEIQTDNVCIKPSFGIWDIRYTVLVTKVEKKPQFIDLPFRISVDECGQVRFTREEILEEICNNITIVDMTGGSKTMLLCRKSDGKVIGEYLKK